MEPHFHDKEGYVKVTLIHNDTVAMYLGLDQRLLVTIPVLKLGGMREKDVALLLAHELSHYLLDH